MVPALPATQQQMAESEDEEDERMEAKGAARISSGKVTAER